MFSAGFWGAYAGSDNHLTRERDPPPKPIELEFPEYRPPFDLVPLTHQSSSHVRDKICRTKSYNDIHDADLARLNIQFKCNVPLSSLIPDGQFATRPFLYDDDLQAMLDEIGVANDDAFREVLRLPPLEGHNKPKLAYGRNFFGSLEDMSRYFDTSSDQYYRVPVNSSVRESSTESVYQSHPLDVQDCQTKEVYRGNRISNAEGMNPGARIAMTKNLLKMVMHKFQCRDHEPIPFPREKLMIRGIKLQSVQYHFCVARIPQDIKQARTRAVEGPLLAVHIRDELRFKKKDRLWSPEKSSFVGERFDLFRELGCMLIVASQRSRGEPSTGQDHPSLGKWWVSKERWGGGPTRWGQLSCEIFEDEDPTLSPAEQYLREERRRQEEAKAANDVDELAVADAKSLSVEDLLAGGGKEPTAGQAIDVRLRKRKPRGPVTEPPIVMREGKRVAYVPPARQRWYQEWKKLRPNSTNNDGKIISRKIGSTDKNGKGFDEVYLISSCNHHVAISKMKVHAEYLEWLENGTELTDTGDVENRKDVLNVQRSSWYDMFDVEARKEFLTGLWRLMCWMNRDEVPRSEYEKVEEKRLSQQKPDPALTNDEQ